jgi:F0F1-type ATP synthase assembly protein I
MPLDLFNFFMTGVNVAFTALFCLYFLIVGMNLGINYVLKERG